VAAVVPAGARVFEVVCGPGRLSIRLAREHGLDVTGLDLDPAMIERARANAERPGDGDERRPSFVVGDVASLGRDLRPGGRALVWDLRPGIMPFHRHVPDPIENALDSPLQVASATPWRRPLEVHPHPADRAGPRWLTRARGTGSSQAGNRPSCDRVFTAYF
jgi:SAM-dependent methyltransferase